MLVIQDNPWYRIYAIDPGTDTMGHAILDYNLKTEQVIVRSAKTVSGEKLSRRFPHIKRVHGDKMSRLIAHESFLGSEFNRWAPSQVVSESPYLGRFPQAFAALTECMSTIRRALFTFDYGMALEIIDPTTAKMSVGVRAKGSTKEDVKKGITKQKDIVYEGTTDWALLDEHSTDAIAVGYAFCLVLKQRLCNATS